MLQHISAPGSALWPHCYQQRIEGCIGTYCIECARWINSNATHGSTRKGWIVIKERDYCGYSVVTDRRGKASAHIARTQNGETAARAGADLKEAPNQQAGATSGTDEQDATDQRRRTRDACSPTRDN